MDRAVTEQKIQEVVGRIVKEYQPEKIILFGSWAWGEPGPDSDMDLLVVKESIKSRLERQRQLRTLLSQIGIALDLLVYTRQELEEKINSDRNLFLEDIVRNGRILYSRSDIEIRLTYKPAELVL